MNAQEWKPEKRPLTEVEVTETIENLEVARKGMIAVGLKFTEIEAYSDTLRMYEMASELKRKVIELGGEA